MRIVHWSFWKITTIICSSLKTSLSDQQLNMSYAPSRAPFSKHWLVYFILMLYILCVLLCKVYRIIFRANFNDRWRLASQIFLWHFSWNFWTRYFCFLNKCVVMYVFGICWKRSVKVCHRVFWELKLVHHQLTAIYRHLHWTALL